MGAFYQLNREDFEEEATKLKNIVIEKLYKDKKIDYETALEWQNNIAIMIRRPNLFKRFWNSLTKDKQEEKHACFILVKQLNLEVEENKEEENKSSEVGGC